MIFPEASKYIERAGSLSLSHSLPFPSTTETFSLETGLKAFILPLPLQGLGHKETKPQTDKPLVIQMSHTPAYSYCRYRHRYVVLQNRN